MKNKIAKVVKKHPQKSIGGVVISIFVLLFIIQKVVVHYSIDSYVNLTLLLLALISVGACVVWIYKDIAIPILEPYVKKHLRIFTFLLIIAPLWMFSFYYVFLSFFQDIYSGDMLFTIRAIGLTAIICSVVVTFKWIKMNFKEKLVNNNNTESIHYDSEKLFDEKLKSATSIKDWIKIDVWNKLTREETWEYFFDEQDNLKNNLPPFYTPRESQLRLQISENIVLTSLFGFLKDNKCFIEDYSWGQLGQISNKHFIVKSVKERGRYEEKRIFSNILMDNYIA